jgi:uncharacterized membrane protein YeaQ/YmgE (transglycosylase-associated protein family)
MILFLLYLAIVGLIVGALGRLAVPGHQDMGILATILCGLAGSFLGGIAGRLLFGANYRGPGLIMSVLGAALIVWIVGGTRRRRTLY